MLGAEPFNCMALQMTFRNNLPMCISHPPFFPLSSSDSVYSKWLSRSSIYLYFAVETQEDVF